MSAEALPTHCEAPAGENSEPGASRLTIRSVDVTGFAVVHPTAAVSRHAIVGAPAEWRDRDTRFPVHVAEGVIVREFARVHAGAERHTIIGARTLLMAGSHVGHDSVVGEDCEVAPNAVIGGCVTLGDRVKVGMNASILPHVVVGDRARIGAGAMVNRDVPAGETWVGVPARRIA